jgi:hypothetical protein
MTTLTPIGVEGFRSLRAIRKRREQKKAEAGQPNNNVPTHIVSSFFSETFIVFDLFTKKISSDPLLITLETRTGTVNVSRLLKNGNIGFFGLCPILLTRFWWFRLNLVSG